MSGPRQVAVNPEVAVGVGRFEFDADILGAVVVECGQHVGGTELAVVEQIARGLVVGVDADFEAGDRTDFLNDAGVEHV